jgi:hypothetical protein
MSSERLTTINTPTRTSNPAGTSKDKRHVAEDLSISFAVLDSERSIMWVPFPIDNDEKELIRMVADSRSTKDRTIKVTRVIHDILRGVWDKTFKAELEKEVDFANRAKAAELTEDDINKKMESLQRQMERAQALLAAKKATTTPKK